MNPRALTLLLTIALVAGALTYFATREAPSADRPDAALKSDGVAPVRRPAEAARSGSRDPGSARMELAGRWSVIVVGPEGEALPNATVAARLGSEVHRSDGRAVFEGLAAGPWQLEVTAEGYPRWLETIDLPPNAIDFRSVVQLSNEIKVSGIVVDQRGDPVSGEPIWLLPEGRDHPVAAPVKDDSLPHVTSGPDGRFRLKVADAGRWRLSAGRQGAPARHVSEPFELAHGPERVAKLVVPAHALLRIRTENDAFEGQTMVSLLAEREVATAPPVTEGGSDGQTFTSGDGLSSDEVERIRKEKAEMSGEQLEDAGLRKPGSGPPSAEELAAMEESRVRMERERARQQLLIPEGWMTVRTVRFTGAAGSEIRDVQPEKSFKFVVYRGAEGMTVPDLLVAPKGATCTLTLQPPVAFPPGTDLPATPRVCGSRLDVKLLGKDALPLGVTFERP